jgi:hypothetical protein
VFGCEGDYTIYDMHPPEIIEVEVPVEVPVEVIVEVPVEVQLKFPAKAAMFGLIPSSSPSQWTALILFG